MKIELKNKELSTAINFLKGMTLQAKDSRCRSKLVKLLTTAFNELTDEEKKLMEENGLLNEEGKLKSESELPKESIRAFNKEQDALMDEVVVIEGGMYAKNIDEMPRILENYTGELSGVDAEIYDRLMDEMEKEEEV